MLASVVRASADLSSSVAGRWKARENTPQSAIVKRSCSARITQSGSSTLGTSGQKNARAVSVPSTIAAMSTP